MSLSALSRKYCATRNQRLQDLALQARAFEAGVLRARADAGLAHHPRRVEIDQQGCQFHFMFHSPSGGGSAMSGAPWILAVPDEPLAIPPEIDAEALFNKEGLVRVSEENTQQRKAVCEAVGLVWRRLILPAFDRLVATGRV